MRDPQQNTRVTRLWKALRDFRDSDLANRWKAEKELFLLLHPKLYEWALKQRLEHHDADEAASFILSAIFQGVGRCLGLDNPDPDLGAAETFSWFRQVRKTRFIDWLRQKKRAPAVAPEQAVEAAAAAEAPAPLEERASQLEQRVGQALTVARQAIRQLIQSKQPDSFYQQARELEVGLSLSELDKQLLVYERVRWEGQRTYDVGVSLGETGKRKQLQDRVSKWVERGRKAYLVGVQYARTHVKDPGVQEALETLEKKLAQPLKRRKA